MRTLRSGSTEQTVAIGEEFGQQLRPGDVVALYGDLGTGKTRFVSGICKALGVHSAVTSPTFTIVHEYPADCGLVAHIDLYRIDTEDALKRIGLEAYFTDSCICIIEWAEHARPFLQPGHYAVSFRFGAKDTDREIDITVSEPAQV